MQSREPADKLGGRSQGGGTWHASAITGAEADRQTGGDSGTGGGDGRCAEVGG